MLFHHLINLIRKALILDLEDATDRFVYTVIYFALRYTKARARKIAELRLFLMLLPE